MGALFGYAVVFLVLLAFVLPVFAASWRSLYILSGISLLVIIGGWLNFYFVSLAPDNFHDVSAIWEQGVLLCLTALLISLCVFTVLRLKGWPKVDNIWLLWGLRLLAFLGTGIASFFAVAFLFSLIGQDRYEAAYCATFTNAPACAGEGN